MRVAVITGASKGIGRAIALRLAREEMHVVLAARSEDLLRDVAGRAGNASFFPCDLREPKAGEELVAFATKTCGQIDVLVNNAGATRRGPFESLTEDDWQDGFALKFFGAVRTTRAAWPYLRSQSGSVVNIAGSGGRTPGAEFSIGGSVNAAMLSFTKALADTGIQDGIQVNAINPGPIRTERLEKRLAQMAAKHSVNAEEALATFIQQEKIMRVGEPADIAELVAFLLSPHGRLLHGSLIDADGGLTKTM